MCNVHIILCLDLNYVLNHGLGRTNIYMTFEAAKCEVYSAHQTEPNQTWQQNKIKQKICRNIYKYIGLRSLSKQFYLLVRVCALQLRLCHGSKQVNGKHIHNFRLIITTTHNNRAKDETKVIESARSTRKKNNSVESLGMRIEPQMI